MKIEATMWTGLGTLLGVCLICLPAAADVWDVGPNLGGLPYTDNTAFNTPNLLVHGAIQVHDLAALNTTETCPVAPCPDEDWYWVPKYPYTSHEVVIEASSPFLTYYPSGSIGPPSLSRHEFAGGVLLQVAMSPSVAPNGTASLRWETGPTGAWAESIAVAHVQHAACGTSCDANAQYTLRFYETTGVIPRFNDANGQVTILILQNTITADGGDGSHLVTGHINFFTGGPSTPPIQVPFQLPENDGLVLNTATVPGLAGLAGRITITHDGHYGQLAGKATAVEPSTGFSFDTPLQNMPH